MHGKRTARRHPHHAPPAHPANTMETVFYMKHARKKNTKKLIAAICAVAVLAALAVGGTAAFFNVSGQAHNVITTKGIKADIHEYALAPDGSWVDYEDPEGVMPGETVSKIPVAVSDEASAQAWVRMFVDTSVTSEGGEALSPSVVSIAYNTDGWTQGGDGWWYCDAPLDGGAQTEPLFESVSLNGPGMGNIYQKCTIKIDISMQAVQTANNGASAMEAAGWPQAEGGEE